MKKILPYLGTSAIFAGLIGAAFMVEAHAKPPRSDVRKTRECIAEQFTKNGIQIAAANNTRHDGFVDGQDLSVSFTHVGNVSLAFKKKEIPLPLPPGYFSRAEELMGNIHAQCTAQIKKHLNLG